MPDRSFGSIFDNQILFVTLVAWAVAQGIKVAVGVVRERRFNFRWFLGSGGMPSSHAAGVSALAASSGLVMGFDSPPFALTAVFALVTMFDAQGVRRATGQQAEILNRILDDIYQYGGVGPQRLKELLGHTPFEVFVGMLLGIVLAVCLM